MILPPPSRPALYDPDAAMGEGPTAEVYVACDKPVFVGLYDQWGRPLHRRSPKIPLGFDLSVRT